MSSYSVSEERDQELQKQKRKMLGNIRFIGELGKLAVVKEAILHKCIQQLLERKRGFSRCELDEDLECLCQILKTAGKRLDVTKAKAWMDQYFERMRSIVKCRDLQSRVKFMLQDVIEMRSNNWEPRKVALEVQPQTIDEIRQSMITKTKFPTSGAVNGATSLSKTQMADYEKAGLVDIFGRAMTNVKPHTANKKYSNRVMELDEDLFDRTYSDSESSSLLDDPEWKNNHERRDVYDNSRDVRDSSRDNSSRDNSQSTRSQRYQLPKLNKPSHAVKASNDALNLRPGSKFNASLRPNTPAQLPRSTVNPNQTNEPNRAPVFTKPNAIIIKTETKKLKKPDKSVKTQKNAQSLTSELLKCTDDFVNDNNTQNIQAFCSKASEFKTSDLPLALCKVCRHMAESALLEDTAGSYPLLLQTLIDENTLTSKQVNQLVGCFVREPEDDLTPTVLASLLSMNAIDIYTMSDLVRHCDELMLKVLSVCMQVNGAEWLEEKFKLSKLNINSLLPEMHSKEDDVILTTLESHSLSSLAPHLVIQRSMWIMIQANSEPQSFFNWITQNVDEEFRSQSTFVRILTKTIIRYVIEKTTLTVDAADETQIPDKQVLDKEKNEFTQYKDILLRYLHENSAKQKLALYALQTLCYYRKFPKGMMLRFFTYLYDLEIVDDDVFIEWKEDINEDYPGKGDALFQVNQWLTWLEEAETESEDEG